MTPQKHLIDKGVSLSVIDTNKFKSSLINITFFVPLTKRSAALNMLLVGVMKRGTQKHPSLAHINRRLDELYDSSVDLKSARLGKNLLFSITADFLDNTYVPSECDLLDGVLELIGAMIYTPNLEDGLFPKKIFEQEKRFLLESIDATVNNTRAYASVRLSEMMFSSDPEFSTIEELRTIINGITNKDLYNFLINEVLTSPIDAFYVGSLPKEKVVGSLKTHIIRPTERTDPVRILPYPEHKVEFVSKTEKMPVSQGKLAMGFKVGTAISENSKKNATALLFNELFGGSASSKLFINVREKLSLCYYCSSSYNQYTGTMTVSAGIENNNLKLAKNAIIKELNDISNGNISDFEFLSAKYSLQNNFKQIYDNPYDLQGFYSNRTFFGFSDSVESTIQLINNVTKDELSSIAKNVICDSIFFVEADKEACDE